MIIDIALQLTQMGTWLDLNCMVLAMARKTPIISIDQSMKFTIQQMAGYVNNPEAHKLFCAICCDQSYARMIATSCGI